MASAAARIIVAVRKRPCPPGEKDVVEANSPQCIINEPKVKYDMTKYTERHTFLFDEVFAANSSNRELYERSARPLLDTVFARGNATCFAYGQTGSGKTHTMLGRSDEPGLYACAAVDLFNRSDQGDMHVFASFYEIYGRKVFDLLNNKEKLAVREDGNQQINICGLTEHQVTNVEELLRIIAAGSQGRAAGQTSANSESSRSHAVLQLEVRENASQRTVGKISFIDLAGNERGSDTFDSDRKTRMEGAEINKSLLALKECIRALGQGKNHIPFRGSILTEILRDSFLGNSRTTMIACISSTSSNCEHSLNTLRYTQRVKDMGKPEGRPVNQRIVEETPARKPVGRQQFNMKGNGNDEIAMMAARLKQQMGGDGGSDRYEDSRDPMSHQAQVHPRPKPKVLRRQAPKRPEWNTDFNDESRAPDPDCADPEVAAVIGKHLVDLDETEANEAYQSDEEGENDSVFPNQSGALPRQHSAVNNKIKAVHTHIVEKITRSEEEIIQQHRRHIDGKMRFMKEEVQLVKNLDADPGSVDEYVTRAADVLTKQLNAVTSMLASIKQIQAYLKDEEVLSKSLTPVARKVRR